MLANMLLYNAVRAYVILPVKVNENHAAALLSDKTKE